MQLIKAKTLLNEYAKEIYGADKKGNPLETLTLGDLIESHRRLRGLRVEAEEYRRQAIAEGKKLGYKYGIDQVNGEYIKISYLKDMTLQEVINLIGMVDSDE